MLSPLAAPWGGEMGAGATTSMRTEGRARAMGKSLVHAVLTNAQVFS